MTRRARADDILNRAEQGAAVGHQEGSGLDLKLQLSPGALGELFNVEEEKEEEEEQRKLKEETKPNDREAE